MEKRLTNIGFWCIIKKGELPYGNTIALHRSETAPLYNRITGARKVLYHTFPSFSRGFPKIGFFVTEFYLSPCQALLALVRIFVFRIKVFSLEFSERNKGRAASVAGTADAKKRQFHAAEGSIGLRQCYSRSGHAERRRKGNDGSLTSFFKRLGFREDLLSPFCGLHL